MYFSRVPPLSKRDFTKLLISELAIFRFQVIGKRIEYENRCMDRCDSHILYLMKVFFSMFDWLACL